MRNLKRVLSLALALVMVLGMMVIGTSAATFTDEEKITNIEAVEVMNALGIVKGDNGQFDPDRVLTREEAAKILAYVTLGEKVEEYLTGSESPFTDVKADRWSAKYITYCKNLGLIHGETETTFNPKGQLTVIGFGKLLLGALGYDTAKYTGSNWINAIDADMKIAGLDVVEYDAKTLITRDAACLMALEAMKQPVGESKGWYYNDPTWKTKLGYFDTFAECFAAAKNLLDTSVNPALVLEDTTSNTMLVKNYAVAFNPNTTDAFGRPAVSYSWKVGNEDVVKLYTAEPAVVVSGVKTAKEIREGMKDYKILVGADLENATAKTLDKIANTDKAFYNNYSSNYKWNGLSVKNVMEDIIHATWSEYEGEDYADFLAANMNANTTWEVYVDENNIITDMVGIETFAATIGTVQKANPATETKASTQVLVDRYTVANIETEAYEQGDIVLVTLSYDRTANNGTFEVVSIEVPETVTGKVSGYTKDGVYTIGEKTYEISDIKGVTLPQNSAFVAAMDAEKKFTLDPNGAILAVGAPDGVEEEEEAALTDYAIVLGANATVKTTTVAWPAESTTVEITAQIQVLLDDGTVAIWDVDVLKAAAPIANTEIVKNDYYFMLGKTPVEVTYSGNDDTDRSSSLSSNLAGKFSGVYTYAEKALVAAVVDKTGSETKDAVVEAANSGNITNVSYVNNGIILNDKTVFVLAKDPTDLSKGYVVKTGLAALENSTISSAKIVTALTAGKNATTGEADATKNVYEAVLVFANTSKFLADTSVAGTDDYVFVDGNYAVSKANGKTYYTYDVVYADGTTGTVTEEVGQSYSALNTGVYKLMDDGSVDTTTQNYYFNGTTKEVKLVSGTTVIFTDDSAMTTTAKTVVIGGELAAKTIAFVVETSNVIELAFVVEDAVVAPI